MSAFYKYNRNLTDNRPLPSILSSLRDDIWALWDEIERLQISINQLNKQLTEQSVDFNKRYAELYKKIEEQKSTLF